MIFFVQFLNFEISLQCKLEIADRKKIITFWKFVTEFFLQFLNFEISLQF